MTSRATGATALVKLGAPSADELGFAKSLKIAEIGGTNVIVLEQVRFDTCIQDASMEASGDVSKGEP